MKTTLHLKAAPECGWFVRVDSVDPPPRLELWGVQLGEIAHHLRSTLNTTLTRIVRAEGGTPPKSLQYPIVYTSAKWWEAKKRGQLGGLPERVVRAIYACQPFVWARATGTKPEDNYLAVLAWLNNHDKHRLEIGGEFAGTWVEYEGRIVTPDGESRLVRPMLTFDWALQPGSRIVDADTSPHVVENISRTTLDFQIEVMVLDELGNVTILQELLEEIWGGYQQAQLALVVAWADENVDFDIFAGATTFKAGSAFGPAAVDAANGPGTWNRDVLQRNRAGGPFSMDADLANNVAGTILRTVQNGLPSKHASLAFDPVQWESIRGLNDVRVEPRTWRGNPSEARRPPRHD
ncbi:MAG: hypothetical protein WED09_00485 [Homoserinimonas sp.]